MLQGVYSKGLRKYIFSLKLNIKNFVRNISNIFLKPFHLKTCELQEQSTLFDKQIFDELNIDQTCMFDVGCNVGNVAIRTWKTIPNVKIHLFEPNPLILDDLEKNIKKVPNKFKKINQLGFSDKKGYLDLSIDPTNTGVSSFEYEFGEKIKCPITTIDQYINDQKLIKVGLCKIDVEGYELQVLEGAKESLSAEIFDALSLELTFTPEKIKSSSFRKVDSFLTKFNYRIQGFYDLDYTHMIKNKGVFKIANVLYLHKSNPFFKSNFKPI